MKHRHLTMGLMMLALGLVAALAAGCDGPSEKKARLLGEGRGLYDRGAYAEARGKFIAAAQIDPRCGEAQWMLGSIALHQRRHASAQRRLARAIELDPANLEARYELGISYLAQGEPTTAWEQAAAILAADPAHPAGRLLAAAVSVAQGHTAEAGPELDRLVLTGVRLPAAYALHAALHRQEGDAAGAMAALVAGIRRLPEAPGLHLMLARQLAEDGRYQAAAVIMGRVADLAPEAAEHRLAQAGLHRLAGQWDEADVILDDLLAARAGDPAVVLAVAELCDSAGMHQRALGVLRVGLEASPGHPALESRWAQLHRKIEFQLLDGRIPSQDSVRLAALSLPEPVSALGQVLSVGLAAGPRADPLVAALAGYPAPPGPPAGAADPPEAAPRAGGLDTGSVPMALWLLGLGVLGLVAVRRRSVHRPR